MAKELRLMVPSGIGDIHWSLTKLEDYRRKKEADHVHIAIADEDRRRGHQLLEACPMVNSWEYMKWPYTKLRYGRVPEGYIPFESNSWLESGNRIEDWLPSYKPNWQVPLLTTDEEESFAVSNHFYGTPMLLLYCSSQKGQKIGRNTWEAYRWDRLATALKRKFHFRIVLVGAEYDDLPVTVFDEDLRGKTTFGEIVELINLADVLIGFHSGLHVIANSMRVPNWMIYWDEPRLRNLPNSWPEPITQERIHRNSFFNLDESQTFTLMSGWYEENRDHFTDLKRGRIEAGNGVIRRL